VTRCSPDGIEDANSEDFSKDPILTYNPSNYSYCFPRVKTISMIFNITKSVLPKYTVNFPVQPAEDFCIQYNVDSENFYDMQTFPQGKLVLFNVRNFKNGMLERQGTDRDADGLCDLFLELGYVAYRYDNSTKAEILTTNGGCI